MPFLKDAKASSSGKKPYKRNDIYHRDAESSSPASGAGLINLIAGHQIGEVSTILQHYMPPRDRTFNKFVGRRQDLDGLWAWFLDRFNTTRLVAGVGGVGKTTLVREFCEELIQKTPPSIQQVIWLSAKKSNFSADINQRIPTEGPLENRFSGELDLYRKILTHFAEPVPEDADEWSKEKYIHSIRECLHHIPSFLVVDDLDSLPHDEQIEIFSTLNSIFAGIGVSTDSASRCIMTARLRLSASMAQYHALKGFSDEDFYKYLKLIYGEFELPVTFAKDIKDISNVP